tara:strand:- start:1157 stop:1909 length:753 start_codon:yes stop_codon:yes gene_type:complete
MKALNSKLLWKNLNGKFKLFTISSTSEKNSHERYWNPFLSKLAAGLLNGLEIFPFDNSSKIFVIDEFSKNTLNHLNDLVDSPSQIHFNTILNDEEKVTDELKDKNEFFDIIYFDLKTKNKIQKIRNYQKFLKKSGFFLVVLNSLKNEIISARNLSNWWNSKTESEKIAIFQIMGIPLTDEEMKNMLLTKFENFSKIWQDNIELNLSKDNNSLIKNEINSIIDDNEISMNLVEEVNLLNFFDSKLLLLQKN